ncbi:MAG: DEAD/DEAH box helicase, partial [Actinomycetota bacterium]|nr:DEAD/DEAH box helicase [Actinomycetota bacterium]
EQPDGGVRVGHHDLGLWGELADAGVVDAQAQQWVRAARALRDMELPQVEPTGVLADLRAYQHDGFRWLTFLWGAGLGGILADDMGLGKTLQTLALVAHARGHGAAPFLVVAPTSVVSVWAHEARTFTPGLVVRTVTEAHARRGTTIAQLAQGADLVVTSYTLYRLEVDSYVAQVWGGLVLDEAQMVKNHRGKTYQSVRRLDVPFRLALTGTPLENRLMELWSLLSIVAPGLYPWPQRFTELVANPVERLGDRDALDRFRRRIRPFLLRRTKELVAPDLPPKQEQVLEVTLTPRHRRVYETHLQRERQTVLGLVGDFQKNRIAIFSSLTRLRQLSLDAGLVDEQYDGIGSAKVDVLVDHLTEITAEGHRALVFSQFTSFLRRVRERLEREGIATAYLDGSTRDRAGVVDGFKQGVEPVFLISLKAGGIGLTLTEADYCFVLDPWWNPAVEAQAVDRAHRIGQTRPVVVYRLVCADTIEEKVMALKARKAALFAQVVDEDALMSVPLGVEDVRALVAD